MPAKLRARLAGCEDGQTLVEYVLILGFVAVLMVGALVALQGGIGAALDTVPGAL